MSDFTEMYWTLADQRRDGQAYDDERRRAELARGNNEGPDTYVNPFQVPVGYTCFHRCKRCDLLIAEFDEPVPESSLKAGWCDTCIRHHIGRLWFQKWKLENGYKS